MKHPYHLVDESPWPLFSGISGFLMTSGLIKFFHIQQTNLLYLSFIAILLIMYNWWKDIISEGAYQGLHLNIVELGLRWGMALFIISEIFFFLSFFWAFFHSSLTPTSEIGSTWPPLGLTPFDPFNIPLLNTILLLSSGVTVTWAHHALMSGNLSAMKQSLTQTIFLGFEFSCSQYDEYLDASFSIADSIYGATFFIATGFHGLHVMIGALFLSVCLYRLLNYEFNANHHFGFEAAAWYWHFVDVVWLFLYSWFYWWGALL